VEHDLVEALISRPGADFEFFLMNAFNLTSYVVGKLFNFSIQIQILCSEVLNYIRCILFQCGYGPAVLAQRTANFEQAKIFDSMEDIF